MSSALTPQQLLEAPVALPDGTKLNLDAIQGDILIGLQKFFERFVFFEITDVQAFKSALRSEIARRITSTHTVHKREFELRDRKAHHDANTDRLPLVGLNLGFTQTGIHKLATGSDLGDASFKNGAVGSAGALGDPVNGSVPTTWLPQFATPKIDGVFLITGGTQQAVDEEFTDLFKILGASAAVAYDETGSTRPGAERGHEHFGWLDGVSQPGIEGLTTPFPGQQLLDPGLFVFGYGQSANPPISWMKDGAFMVFRRLKQLVPELDQFLLSEGADLGLDPVLLGARLVGRWQSGAPLELTPLQDDETTGPDPQHNNNFDFSDDQAQRRCPFGAHIRKTNPRKDIAEAGLDPHRIIRAGIPFGPEVTASEQASGKTQQERGLMFVCYQTSILNQFEFVQSKWANNPNFVFNKKRPNDPNGPAIQVGFDPIIGQNSTLPSRERTTDEPIPNYPTGNVRSTLTEPQDFIVPTAGAYFFVPSIEALRGELSS